MPDAQPSNDNDQEAAGRRSAPDELKSKRTTRLTIIGITLILAASTLALFVRDSGQDSGQSQQAAAPDNIQTAYEKIPKSVRQSPDSTWWGYNQSKIVRYKDTVFMYVIENSDDRTKPSTFRLYKKTGNGEWTPGAGFDTSRPGNILIDSKGVLHAFVFEAFDMVENDSLGRLIHYWLPKAAEGDIRTFKSEAVVDRDPANPGEELVNIRIGAAIAGDDTMVVAFGLNPGQVYESYTEQVYYKKPDEPSWHHSLAGANLGHEFYYPFVAASKDRIGLLSVQDDYYEVPGGAENLYHKIMFFDFDGQAWKRELIVDHSSHPKAFTQYRLVEQSELFLDSSNRMHIIYKEFLDSSNGNYAVSAIKHIQETSNGRQTTELKLSPNEYKLAGGKSRGFADTEFRWVRLFETDGDLYYLMSTHERVYISKAGSDTLYPLNLPDDARDIYTYIANGKGGSDDSQYVDILVLSADSMRYAQSSNYYLRIDKSEL